MAENLNIKVSYTQRTDLGLEDVRETDIYSITEEDKQKVVKLVFLPVDYEGKINVTDLLKGFVNLEGLYLPSMMTTTLDRAKKYSSKLKTLVILSRDTFEQNMSSRIVSVKGSREEDDNDVELSAFLLAGKDGANSLLLNPTHIKNHVTMPETLANAINYLTTEQVDDYLSGEKGLVALIDQINDGIENRKNRVDLDKNMLRNLLEIIIEKGVTFEQFTIDFSKLYDKIELYKSEVRNSDTTEIKDTVEGYVSETFQNVQETHYKRVLKDTATTMSKLVTGVDANTENLLLADLYRYVLNLVVASPKLTDEYKEDNTADAILDDVVSGVMENVKSVKVSGRLRSSLEQIVNTFKGNKEDLYARIDKCLADKVDVDWVEETFAKKFGLDLSKRQSRNLADGFADALATKNFATLVKDDVLGIIANVKKEMGNGEIRSKEMLELVGKVVQNFPTKEEIYNVLVDFVAKNGYKAIK